MKFAGLALVALTGLATAVPIAQEPAADPGPDYSYYNRFCVNDWANLQTCNLDNHFQSCNNGIATVYTCVDGCHLSYADVTRKNSKQSAEEASAPAVPEIIPTEPPSDSVNISPAASPSPSPSRPKRAKGGGSEGSLCGCAPGLANVGVLVAVGAVLGFKAWGLYERGVLGWKEIGFGAGILGGVGAVEAVVGRCLQQRRN